MISKNFYESLELIAQERNLEITDIADKIAIAMKKACQLEGVKGDIEVDFNYDKKEIRVYSILTVVAEIDPEGPEGQILLPDAKLIKERVRVGSTIRRKVDFEKEVGRKGAAQFKQLFTQGLKELGRKRAYEFFKDHENEMITATINKVLDEAVILGIGMDYDAYMPKSEALPTDVLIAGRQLKVYITKVEEAGKGPKVYVSRTHRDIVKRLFENAVPEVSSGVVEIVNVSRAPGFRSKVGVKANFLIPSATLFSRISLHFLTRSITKGIFLISLGDTPFNHKQYLFLLCKNSTAPNKGLIYFFDSGHFNTNSSYSFSSKTNSPFSFLGAKNPRFLL